MSPTSCQTAPPRVREANCTDTFVMGQTFDRSFFIFFCYMLAVWCFISSFISSMIGFDRPVDSLLRMKRCRVEHRQSGVFLPDQQCDLRAAENDGLCAASLQVFDHVLIDRS